MASLSLFAIAVLAFFTAVHSHGLMCEPRQRGAYHSSKCGSNLPSPKNPLTDFCAHCLNGGTVHNVAKHLPRSGWSTYDPLRLPSTAARAGLCGDPFGGTDHMIGGKYVSYPQTPIVAQWKAGQVVNLEVEIDTNHNGYFEFFLCDLDSCKSKDISGKCMRNGHCYRLNRVAHRDCQKPSRKTHFECGPIDKNYPGRWYVPCRKTGHVGVHLVGGARGTMKYRLPKGVSCKHCVLQWYWGSANSCAPEGFLNYFKNYKNPFGVTCSSDGGGRGGYRPGMTPCGGRLLPEEFWSCADVQISPSGNAGNKELMKEMGKAEDAANPQPSEPLDSGIQSSQNVAVSTQPATPKRKPTKDIRPAASNGNRGKPGKCLKYEEACNGNIPCCGNRMVCVYTRSSGFTCKVWYTLWKEAMGFN